jgi:hypothetical protein
MSPVATGRIKSLQESLEEALQGKVEDKKTIAMYEAFFADLLNTNDDIVIGMYSLFNFYHRLMRCVTASQTGVLEGTPKYQDKCQ